MPAKTEKGGETLLYKIVIQHALTSQGAWFEAQPLLVETLVTKYPELLVAHDNSGKTPLHLAIEECEDELVHAMLYRYENRSEALRQLDSKGNNCLHAAVQVQLHQHTVLALVTFADEDILGASNNDGLTPLHLAVEHKKLLQEHRQLLIETLIEKEDCALDQWKESGHHPHGISVYRYYEETRKSFYNQKKIDMQKEQKRKEQNENKEDHHGLLNPQLDKHNSQRQYGPIDDAETQQGKPKDPPDTVETRKGGTQKPTSTESREFGKPLPSREDLGGLGTGKARGPIPCAADFPSEENDEENKSAEAKVRAKKIIQGVKLRYLRTRDPYQAATFLYGRNLDGE